MIALLLLIVLLTISIVTDLHSRRIPNTLICTGLLIGFSLSVFNFNGNITPTDSLLGALVGLALFLPIYLIGKMGAGDVKLLAMCGSFLGIETTLLAGFCSLLVGGFLALLWVWITNKYDIKDKRYPYAAAIAAGTVLAPYVHFV